MFEKASDIAAARTRSLRRLALIAGGDPATFYRDADLSSADLRGQDLRGMDMSTANIEGVRINRRTRADPDLLSRLLNATRLSIADAFAGTGPSYSETEVRERVSDVAEILVACGRLEEAGDLLSSVVDLNSLQGFVEPQRAELPSGASASNFEPWAHVLGEVNAARNKSEQDQQDTFLSIQRWLYGAGRLETERARALQELMLSPLYEYTRYADHIDLMVADWLLRQSDPIISAPVAFLLAISARSEFGETGVWHWMRKFVNASLVGPAKTDEIMDAIDAWLERSPDAEDIDSLLRGIATSSFNRVAHDRVVGTQARLRAQLSVLRSPIAT